VDVFLLLITQPPYLGVCEQDIPYIYYGFILAQLFDGFKRIRESLILKFCKGEGMGDSWGFFYIRGGKGTGGTYPQPLICIKLSWFFPLPAKLVGEL
jgi:hypothetical protein